MKITLFTHFFSFTVLLLAGITTLAQVPAVYFRITRCNDIKARVMINEKIIHTGECAGKLAWHPVFINEALLDEKNKLRMEISNERSDSFYGALTFELIRADSANNIFKQFYSYEIKLQEYDRFQMNIDNLIKKQGWVASAIPAKDQGEFVKRYNRRDSLNYFFDKQDRYYLTITAAKHANYLISINEIPVMKGTLNINSLKEAYALATYPFFF
jgi:hypothetical protein